MFGKKNEHEWKMFVHTNGRMVCQCVWQYICALSYERTTERAKEEDRIRARERHTLETGIEHRIKTMRTKKKKHAQMHRIAAPQSHMLEPYMYS